MGIELAPQSSDWYSTTMRKKGAYPRKFKDYLHVWECKPDISDENLSNSTPLDINSINKIEETSCYIIIHIQYKKLGHHSLCKDFTTKAQAESKRWKELFRSFSSIKKSSLNKPLIRKELSGVSASSADYEIYVWTGNKSNPSIRSVAIAEAYKLDQILKTNKSSTGTLRMVCNNDFTFLPFDMESLYSLLERHKEKNHLIYSLITMGKFKINRKIKKQKKKFFSFLNRKISYLNRLSYNII